VTVSPSSTRASGGIGRVKGAAERLEPGRAIMATRGQGEPQPDQGAATRPGQTSWNSGPSETAPVKARVLPRPLDGTRGGRRIPGFRRNEFNPLDSWRSVHWQGWGEGPLETLGANSPEAPLALTPRRPLSRCLRRALRRFRAGASRRLGGWIAPLLARLRACSASIRSITLSPEAAARSHRRSAILFRFDQGKQRHLRTVVELLGRTGT